jgi:hypothetical protein
LFELNETARLSVFLKNERPVRGMILNRQKPAKVLIGLNQAFIKHVLTNKRMISPSENHGKIIFGYGP